MMFGKLQGSIDYVGNGFIILMTGGVGYKVFLPANVLANAVTGSTVSYWIETIVREDAINLIGFDSMSMQDMFVKLTGVSGIGTKVALAILGFFKIGVLESAIASGDIATLTEAPGVGKKVAERIIVELKGKTFGTNIMVDAGGSDGVGMDVYNDVLAALEALGYRRADCVEMVQRLVMENPADNVQTLITKVLKKYAGGK